MQTALPQQTSWVTIAIFALAGGVAGLLAGGLLPAAAGSCAGLALGALAGPSLTRLGYIASCATLLYGGATCYTEASLTGFVDAQTATLTQTLPPGSSFDRVYTYLKGRHASVAQVDAPSTLTAVYETRFLLSSVRFRTKFVFDKHEHLTHVWVRPLT